MKHILLLVLACAISSLLSAQQEYEPSTTNPFGLPNPEAPSEIKDFQSMIGICDCLATSRNKDRSWSNPVKMTWEFTYIMNGSAVQDHVLKTNGEHAGSIRQYVADSSRWYVHYYSSARPTSQLATWEGGKTENDIVLSKNHPAPNGAEGTYRITFSDISEAGFNWIGEWVSIDESIVYPTKKIECIKRKSN